ncbi:hypothetical protein HanRHA438_Chr09g0398081 [Helianthus annuus]|nr:hypothetical protein HanRHA438_Chr09g0398081 [Helianthus annuus]
MMYGVAKELKAEECLSLRELYAKKISDVNAGRSTHTLQFPECETNRRKLVDVYAYDKVFSINDNITNKKLKTSEHIQNKE